MAFGFARAPQNVRGRWGLQAIALAILVALVAWGCGDDRPRASRVVLVSIDTLRADHVGCYGADFAFTPTMDGLADRGVRFATAISPVPLTLPSHATLLTGLDPPHHGVRHNGIYQLSDDVPTLAERFAGEGFGTAAFVGAFVLNGKFGLGRGFEHYDDQTSRSAAPGGGIVGYAERTADQVVDAALAWLENAPPRFFLFVHLYDPHRHFQPPSGFLAAMPGRPYDGEIAFTDAQVGRLLAAIDARHPDGATLVAVTSDHGEGLGEHGELSHSHFIYDATQHIPLLMAGPRLPAGQVVEEVVALRDVSATILDLMGLDPLEGATGRTLEPLTRGVRKQSVPAYMETLSTQLDWGWSPLLGLRTDRHKYIRAPRPELYDLIADPAEKRNLVDEEPGRVAEFEASLDRALQGARPAAPNRKANAVDRARLEALGYVVPEPTETPGATLGRVGGLDPKDEMPLVAAIFRADALLADGRPTHSLDLLDTLDADHHLFHVLVAAAALGSGDPERSETAARRAIETNPSRGTGYSRLADALEYRGEWDEVRTVLRELRALDSDAGEVLAAMGRLDERAGDLESAKRQYRAALDAAQPGYQARWRLAAILLEAGKRQEAESLLTEVTAEQRARGPVARRLADAELALGNLEAALAHLEPALAERAALPVRLLEAEILDQLGRTAQARESRLQTVALADRMLNVAGRFPTVIYLWRARALEGLGERAEAREALRPVLEQSDALSFEDRQTMRALAARLGVQVRGLR